MGNNLITGIGGLAYW